MLLLGLASTVWPGVPGYQISSDSQSMTEFPVKMVVDETGTMTLEQVLGSPEKGSNKFSRFVLPAQPTNVWLGFRLENHTERPVTRLVGFDEPHLVKADLYISQGNGFQLIQNGLEVPLSRRPYNSRLPVFRVELAPGQSRTLYLMANSAYPNTTVGLFVSTVNEFEEQQRLNIILQSLFLGGLGALLVYNLFLFISLKERLYLLYVLHGALFGMFVYSYSGLAVLTDISAVGFNRFGAATTAGQAVFLLFTRDILNTPRRIPRIDKGLLGLAGVLFVLAGFVFADTNHYRYLVLLAMPLIILELGLGVHAAAKGYPMGKFYLLGTSWYLLGMLVLAALNQGLIPYNLFTRYGFLAGSFTELMVFSLALAYRVKLLQDEKSEFQQQLLRQSKTEKERLERVVKERTAELEQANKELDILSKHDGLTGLHNRRVFDQELERQCQSALRNKTDISLIICDIDHFKLYNDHLGHLAGDDCLKKVAALIQSECRRATDFTARYGGEEFVVILPGTELEMAGRQAERIRLAVAAAGLDHPASPLGKVTISLGVACQPAGQGAAIPADLVAPADEALYVAKEQGRDRVVLAKA